MSCLGVHFALTDEEVETLLAIDDELERLEYITDEIEEEYFENHQHFLAQSDKAWDALHRALSDGELSWTGGDYPLNHVILAGESLYSEDDYIMSLKTPKQVAEIAVALRAISEQELRTRYFAIGKRPTDYGELSEEDFQYTWGAFQEVRDLYSRAAAAGRHVLFTVDQ